MKEKIGKFDSKKSKKKSENLRQKMKEKKGNLTAKMKGAIGKWDKKSSDSAIIEKEIEVIYIFTIN